MTLLADSPCWDREYKVDVDISSWQLFTGALAIDFHICQNDLEDLYSSVPPPVTSHRKMTSTPSSAKRKLQSMDISIMMDKLISNIHDHAVSCVEDDGTNGFSGSEIDWMGMDDEFITADDVELGLLSSPSLNRFPLAKLYSYDFRSSYLTRGTFPMFKASKIELPR
jgi:hypothetical protein